MSDRVTIVAEPRGVVGKQVKQLRREGWIPGVVYGQREPVLVQMENNPLRRALRVAGTTQLVNLDIAGDQRTVLVREIQQHLTRGDLFHIDFLEVSMTEKITAEAELITVGEAVPEAEGLGVVTQPLRHVTIECLPNDLVSEIEVDLSLIKTTEDVIFVRDLISPKGVTILTDPEQPVARFEYAPGVEEEEEAEAEELFAPTADAVEVIGRGKKEDEEDF